MKRIAFFVTVFLLLFSAKAQDDYYHLGFSRDYSVNISREDGTLLKYPWIGGINSIYFSTIDLNFDGHQDLIGFEKHGARLIPLLWNPVTEEYDYAPEYVRFFPELHDWAIFKDYNFDGKADIFTYGLGSIRVFKQTSTNDTLRFELVADPLESFYYNGLVNIFSSPDDYLAIADIDQDGDLDILNFWVLGKYVHWQRNMSMELYGHADSLNFVLEDECWGEFNEAADDNVITLFSYCELKDWDPMEDYDRHIGSSMKIIDYNADGLPDLLIGDVDYPDLILLINGGTLDSALMVSQTTDFPNATDPIYLFSMPAVNYIDLDRDGVPEILVSPSDPSLNKSQDHNSLWRYDYNPQSMQYELTTTSWLQDETVDVGSAAYPVLFDWDQDGLLDLFVSNFGSYDSSNYVNGVQKSYYASQIHYYRNIGTTTTPHFQLVTDDFGNLRSYNLQSLYPAFGDIDGDGAIDLLCGAHDGKIIFFKNENIGGGLPAYAPPAFNFGNISVTSQSTPQLYDIDRDGDLDLLIGNRRGNIAYYRNVGSTGTAQFELVTTTFGDVDVRNAELSYFGYAAPCFFEYRDTKLLVCANEQGELLFYKDIDENLDGTFTREWNLVETIDHQPYFIREGIRCGVAIADLDGDGILDMIVGNWAGGLSYFKGSDPIQVSVPVVEEEIIRCYPNPTTDFLHIEVNAPSFQYQIYSIMGHLLASAEVNESMAYYSCSHLPAGLYILKVVTGQKVYSTKFVVVE